jgi:cytochrome c biogenesis protein CcdA
VSRCGARCAHLAAASITSALTFGVTLTVAELATAIPYIGGLGSIARADVSLVSEVGLLVAFNLIYHAPPVALVLAWRR